MIVGFLFFIDPVGVHGVIDIFQFNQSVFFIIIILFILNYNLLTVRFVMVIIKSSDKLRLMKYPAILGNSIPMAVTIIWLIYVISNFSTWHVSEYDFKIGRTEILFAIVHFSIQLVVFFFRCAIIIRKLFKLSSAKSENEKKKRLEYFRVAFLLIFISLSHALQLACISAVYATYNNSDAKIRMIILVIYYFSFMMVAFSTPLLFKPKIKRANYKLDDKL